jgi:hypothetical protein
LPTPTTLEASVKTLLLLAALIAPPAGAAPPATPVAPAEKPSLPAQPPSAQAIALVAVLKGDVIVDRMYAQMAPLAAVQVAAMMDAGPATRPYAERLANRLPGGRERLVALLSEEFLREMRKTTPELMRAAAAYYDRRFSPDEMDEMIRFFSSGTGAKYISVQPDMQRELEPIGQALGEKAGKIAAPRALRRAEQEAGGKAPDPGV